MKQTEPETLDQYVTRLTLKAETCNFGDGKQDRIKDQVIYGCREKVLRQKFLEKDVSLPVMQALARSKEAAMSLSDRMNSGASVNNGKDGSSQGVNRLIQKPKYSGQQFKGYKGKADGSASGHSKKFDGTEC